MSRICQQGIDAVVAQIISPARRVPGGTLMARKSKILANERRRQTVARYAERSA